MPNDAKRLGARHTTTRALAASAAMMVCVTGAFAQADEPIKPIPLSANVDARKVALGDRLFHDKRLSKDNTLSCASCHDLAKGGVDGQVSSTGINGAKGPINAPTVFNSALNFRQFWDGRAASLEEQAAGPVHNPKEMGTNWGEVLGKLSQDTELMAQFKAAYPGWAAAEEHPGRDRHLRARPRSRRTRASTYLRGDKATPQRRRERGYQLFKSLRLHRLPPGRERRRQHVPAFGVMGDYFAKRGNVGQADLGRYARDEERGRQARVQGAEPAQHRADGAVLPRRLGGHAARGGRRDVPLPARATGLGQDKELIVKFLHTLTGEYKGRSLESSTVSASR